MPFLAVNWKGLEAMRTVALRIPVASRDHFSLKGTRASWRNNSLQALGTGKVQGKQRSKETISDLEVNVKDSATNFKGRLKYMRSTKTHQLIMILKEEKKNTRVHTQQLINKPVAGEWSLHWYFNPEFPQRWETSPFTL